jgi:glycosyltransferase involved in cell wall biosynthesis
MPEGRARPLRILHVLRAPVGGLFRHVADLARGQLARGHQVGLIVDSAAGGSRAEAMLSDLAAHLGLGLTRVAMSRHIGWRDLSALGHVARRVSEAALDVVHGHGAKGGAYARLVHGRAVRAYTPHGGSLHFERRSPLGFAYLALERVLARRTELLLFESAFAREVFLAKVGEIRAVARVVHNGLTAAEFEAIEPIGEAADFVFVGELRALKGVHVLIEALAKLAAMRRSVRAVIVGGGPDAQEFAALARARRIDRFVRFQGPLPAREAFRLGRVLVVPSLAESLPYVVLEAAAAAVPLVATRVGGIPEIFGPHSGRLIPPGDAAALSAAMARALDDPGAHHAAALELRQRVRAEFSADVMVEQVLGAYAEALARPAVPPASN